MAKEKLLGDVPLPKGMGANMANAACKMWRDWKIPFKRLIALGFDTTGTMTGSQQGEAAMNRIIDRVRDRREIFFISKIGFHQFSREMHFLC